MSEKDVVIRVRYDVDDSELQRSLRDASGGQGPSGGGAQGAIGRESGGGSGRGAPGGGGGGAADTEAPEVSLDSGVVSVDHVFDAEDHADGVEVGGSGEAGVAIVVDINGETQETVVGEDGTWQVVFDPTQVPEGEYDVDVTITATDAAGNATTITDVVRVDTVTTVGVVAIDGAATGSGVDGASGVSGVSSFVSSAMMRPLDG
mgnify:CR=1 FL=1